MKKIIILLSLVVMFSGCQIAWELQDQHNIEQIGNHPLYYSEDFEGLITYRMISNYINSRVEYVESPIVNSPEKTLELGYAGCAGYAKLFSNIAYFSMGIKMDIVAVIQSEEFRAIDDGGFSDHAINMYGREIIDSQTGEIVIYDSIPYIYDFDSFLY